MADQYVHQAAGTHQTSERREAQVPVCSTGHPGRHLRGQDLPEDSGFMQFSPEIVEVLKVGLSVKLYFVNLPAGQLEPTSIAIENTASYIDVIGGFNGKITKGWLLRCFVKRKVVRSHYSCLEVPLICNFLNKKSNLFSS